MKLKISQDADAPVERVFQGFTDFDRIEDRIRSRGLDVVRVGGWQHPAVGAGWTGRGELRGKMRRFEGQITEMTPGRALTIEGRVGGLRLSYDVLLVPLGDQVTRVNVTTDLRPGTLSARLLVQSLKIARTRVRNQMQGWLSAELRAIVAGS